MKIIEQPYLKETVLCNGNGKPCYMIKPTVPSGIVRKNSSLNALTALLKILSAPEDVNDNDSRLNLVHKPSNILSMTFFFIYAAE